MEKISRSSRTWARAAGALTGLVALGCASWIIGGSGRGPLDRFWTPVVDAPGDPVIGLNSSNTYMLSSSLQQAYNRIPQDATDAPLLTIQPNEIAHLSNYHISVGNLTAINGISQLLARRGKSVQIRWASELTAEDVRGRAIILVGAFSNPWTMRKSAEWRYQFRLGTPESPGNAIVDQTQPGVRWAVTAIVPWQKQTVDYGLISRVHGPGPGEVSVTTAGVKSFGTQVAGLFLSDPSYMRDLAPRLPKGWERKNLQIVLETSVQGMKPGPPRVVATHVW
jgi:hypothetical protein